MALTNPLLIASGAEAIKLLVRSDIGCVGISSGVKDLAMGHVREVCVRIESLFTRSLQPTRPMKINVHTSAN